MMDATDKTSKMSATYTAFPAWEGGREVGWTFGRTEYFWCGDEAGWQQRDIPEPGVKPALSMSWALRQAAKRNESIMPELAAEQLALAKQYP